MRFLVLAAVAPLAWSVPAAAAASHQQGSVPVAEAGSDAQTARISAELEIYTDWLVALDHAQAPAMQALVALQGHWQRATAPGQPRGAAAAFHAIIDQTLAAIDQSNAGLAALEIPNVDSLHLPADLRPQALLENVQRNNGDLRTAVRSFGPLLDALLRNDARASSAASWQLIDALRLIVESQITLTRASLSAIPRDESSWEMTNIQLVVMRMMGRVLEIMPQVDRGVPVASFRADLVAAADELDATAGIGSSKIEAELVTLTALLAEAEQSRDTNAASILRRSVAALRVDRQIFPVAHELAATVRRQAPQFGGRIAFADLQRLADTLRVVRLRLDEIASAEAAAAAAE